MSSNIGASNKIIQGAKVVGIVFCLSSEFIFGITFVAFGSVMAAMNILNMISKNRKLNHWFANTSAAILDAGIIRFRFLFLVGFGIGLFR